MREYIIHLQSRLIETQGDLPPPPANVNLAHPGTARHDGAAAAMAPMTQLQASAARGLAAASLGKEEQHYEQKQQQLQQQQQRYKSGPAEESTTDEDVIRAQLQAGVPHL